MIGVLLIAWSPCLPAYFWLSERPQVILDFLGWFYLIPTFFLAQHVVMSTLVVWYGKPLIPAGMRTLSELEVGERRREYQKRVS